jgi:hypothetical protein
VGVLVGVGIGIETAIGQRFDIDADSDPDTDSDPGISRYGLYFRSSLSCPGGAPKRMKMESIPDFQSQPPTPVFETESE